VTGLVRGLLKIGTEVGEEDRDRGTYVEGREARGEEEGALLTVVHKEMKETKGDQAEIKNKRMHFQSYHVVHF
jgi:hypothetical protein